LIVAFDASVLIYVLDEQAKAPTDPATGAPVDRCKERVFHLIASLQRQNAKIVIPTPALGEVLVRAIKAGPEFLRILSGSRRFVVASFDERAAVEFAARQAERASTERRGVGAARVKAKFDDQIVAISAVHGVETIYSDDADIKALVAGRVAVVGIAELSLPPESAQTELRLQTDEDDAGSDG
jgi:predicted nucleic acid-binding protein